MTTSVKIIFSVLIAPAILIGFVKLGRRVIRREMCIISTPDDYFSLAAVEIFLLAAVMALMTSVPFWRVAYFLVTAAFLLYLPFSKVSHYIYFFARFIMGNRYGWRGVILQTEQAKRSSR